MRNSELEILWEAEEGQRDVARCVLYLLYGMYFYRVKYIDSQGEEYPITICVSGNQVDRIFSRVQEEYNWAWVQKRLRRRRSKRRR